MPQELSSADSDCSAAAILALSPSTTQRRRMKLCSRIRGRERWQVKLLENHPRLAAAVELVLQTEPGVLEARANPVTGRVLVLYDPATLTDPVESLLRRALESSPLSREEFRLLRPKPRRVASHRRLLALEATCSLFHVVLMGGFCPLGLACAAALFLVERTSHSHRPISTPLGYSESAATN
jgi:hypothetical protein